MECGFISWLNQWQTLLGAAIGGLMGFIGAWWVARSPGIKNEITAAQIIIATILSIKVKTESIDVQLIRANEKNNKLEFILQYLKREPIPPPSFYSDIRTVMPCNYELAIKLTELRIIWQSVDNAILSIKRRINKCEEINQKLQPSPYLEADIDTIYKGIHLITSQANDNIALLEKNVISKFRFVNNLMPALKSTYRRIFRKNTG